jgi:hypothetical protein
MSSTNNAHCTSTPAWRRPRSQSIARALGSAADEHSVTSTKSMTGHLLGCTVALETFATVMALRDRISPATIILANPEPYLGIQSPRTPRAICQSGPLSALTTRSVRRAQCGVVRYHDNMNELLRPAAPRQRQTASPTLYSGCRIGSLCF